MKNILGIGTAGSKITDHLSKYNQYKTYTINNEHQRTTKYKFSLERLPGPEDYDQFKTKKLEKWLLNIEDNCTIILCGGSISSAVTLQVCKILHDNAVKIDIVYFVPEVELLSEEQALNERSVRNILQNYTRSGVFGKMCLISNLELEKLCGSTSVYEHYQQLNDTFSNIYYMVDVFKNTKPITSSLRRTKDHNRIYTIGGSSLEGEEFLLYPLVSISEIRNYYAINEERLKTDTSLFRKITDDVKLKITDETRASFGVYSTKYEEDYVYTEQFSSKIQENF